MKVGSPHPERAAAEPMLVLGTGDPRDVGSVLAAPGGFAWWYCDLVDAAGDGLVLHWSFGLPFLPGARARPEPRERPALSVAVYRNGRTSHYALCELPPAAVRWRNGSPSFDFGVAHLGLTLTAAEARLHAVLDLPVAGARTRLRGSIDVVGPRISVTRAGGVATAPAAAGAHAWTPLGAGLEGRASLRSGGEAVELEGRAYLDANRSARPLDALGIRAWQWGRLSLGARELVYYLVAPDEPGAPVVRYLFEVGPSGRAHLEPEPLVGRLGPRRNLFGLGWHEELRLGRTAGRDVRVRVRHVVDDGPFYQRYLVEGTCDATGERGHGVAEHVVPARVDRPWQRPLVAMRRQGHAGRDSAWLPLFDGPARGRLGRLVRHWLGLRRASEVRP
ncbi:MAG: hypothetical protein IT373_35685 [Polyangiaceae bacterium]|nr:hypothetical protein [Polyangiaceae bacterium]